MIFLDHKKMQEKWAGLMRVIAGGVAAGLLWAILRRKEKFALRRQLAEATSTKQSGSARAEIEDSSAAGRSSRNVVFLNPHSSHESQANPLYEISENQLVVHQMLLTGSDEIQFRDFSGGSSGSGSTPTSPPDPLSSLAQQVKAAAEAAFFNQLREGLAQEEPQLKRLVSLILDASSQLEELIPRSAREGREMREAMREKLDKAYLSHRLTQGYDPGYLAQVFSFLVHIISQLQAPARREGTKQRYAQVAAQFAAATSAASRTASAGGRAGEGEGPRVGVPTAAGGKERWWGAGGSAAREGEAVEEAAQKLAWLRSPPPPPLDPTSAAEEGQGERVGEGLLAIQGPASEPRSTAPYRSHGHPAQPRGGPSPSAMSTQVAPSVPPPQAPSPQTLAAAARGSSAVPPSIPAPSPSALSRMSRRSPLPAERSAEAAEQPGTPWDHPEGDSVSLQFVVRESVQSVRVIMRIVQEHWLERYGGTVTDAGAVPALSRTSSAAGTPGAVPHGPLQRGGSTAGEAPLSPQSSWGGTPPKGAVPHSGFHLYRGPSSSRRRSSEGATCSPSSAAAPPATTAGMEQLGIATCGIAQQGGSTAAAACMEQGVESGVGSRGSGTSGTAEQQGGSTNGTPEQPLQDAAPGQEQGGRPLRRLAGAEVAALVGASRFLWEQLNELKSDVAKARLSLLKDAITSGTSGIEYERQRYERAVAGVAPGQAMPRAHAWIRAASAQLGGRGLQGQEGVGACVAAGIVLLLQRSTALTPAECPETLLLDCRGLVELQNELQRVCLLIASCLIAQQLLAGGQGGLGPHQLRSLKGDITRRMGVLLRSGVDLEGISVELHHLITMALAAAASPTQAEAQGVRAPNPPQQAQQQLGEGQGRQGETQQEVEGLGSAAGMGPVSGGMLPSGEPHLPPEGKFPPGSALPQPASRNAAGSGDGTAGQGAGAAGGAAQVQDPPSGRVSAEVVRRMVRRIFSTEDAVYRRIQARVCAALTALLTAAAVEEGAARCQQLLKGIGGEAAAEEVLALGGGVERVAALNAAVCGPYYTSMLHAQ